MRLGRWVHRPSKYACYSRWYRFENGVIVNNWYNSETDTRTTSWCSHIAADDLSKDDWEVVEDEEHEL
jgi:hypothetical protein